MSFSPFMQAGLQTLLEKTLSHSTTIIRSAPALIKLGKLLYDHFTKPAQHLLPGYRNGYQKTLFALRLTIDPPCLLGLQIPRLQSKVVKDFQQDIRTYFLPTFEQQRALDKALCQQLAKECQILESHILFSQESVNLGTQQAFDANLATFVNAPQLLNLTELVLADVQQKFTVSPELLALLRLDDLLGCGLWHFLRANAELSQLIAALQTEKLFQVVQHIEAGVTDIQENMQDVLKMLRNVHWFAEYAMNNYADIESLKALEEAKRYLPQNRPSLLGLTQAFKNGNPQKARDLMLQALKQAAEKEEKALIHYSLFKLVVAEREPNLTQAFQHLQTAIALDEVHYAPCDPLVFQLQGLLGIGGMGYALLAKSGREQLVIKCFWQDLQDKQLSEAVKMQQISADYIPRLFGNGIQRHGQRLCLVTHYLPNTLDGARWLREKGKLSEAVGLIVALRLAEALQAIHAAGVLHLDLKPANVLLLPAKSAAEWHLRLIDFGLSKLLPQLGGSQHTRTLTGTVAHTVTITFEYASPEQKAGKRMTPASDVYSYGKTMMDLLGDIHGFEVPERLGQVLRLCLKGKPEERIGLSELVGQLRSLLGEEIFTFDVVLVDSKGKEISRKSQQNRQKAVDLGKGEKLEVAYLPEGQLMVGGTEEEHQMVMAMVKKYGWNEENNKEWLSWEKPRHSVTITKSFWMGRYPITVGQFKRFVEETSYQTEAETGDGAYVLADGNWGQKKDASWKNPYFKQTDKCPVVCISWKDAQRFIAWLNQKQKDCTFRLPSEAEWEYACRAKTDTPFHCGETIAPNLVNYDGNYPYGDAPKGEYRQKTVEVDYFKHANDFGLYQMHGNVWEWCEDVWHGNYKDAPTDGSAWVRGGEQNNHVLRGGSWGNDARYCRAAYRAWYNLWNASHGFRVVVPC